MPRIEYVGEQDVRFLAERLTARLFSDSPAFRLLGDSGRERLLAALAQPQWPQYRLLPVKTATLHYHLNKGHAYADGNKRIALAASDLFLLKNKAFLVASATELEILALGVAGNSISPDENRRFFVERCVRLTWTEEQINRWLNRTPLDAIAPGLERGELMAATVIELIAEVRAATN